MQLNEIQALMFGRILRDSVVPAKSRTYLRELDRREFVDEAPAGFLAIRHRAVRVEKFIGNLEIVAASDEPIGLEQGRELVALSIGNALVVGDFRLREPGDRSGPQAPDYGERGCGP